MKKPNQFALLVFLIGVVALSVGLLLPKGVWRADAPMMPGHLALLALLSYAVSFSLFGQRDGAGNPISSSALRRNSVFSAAKLTGHSKNLVVVEGLITAFGDDNFIKIQKLLEAAEKGNTFLHLAKKKFKDGSTEAWCTATQITTSNVKETLGYGALTDCKDRDDVIKGLGGTLWHVKPI